MKLLALVVGAAFAGAAAAPALAGDNSSAAAPARTAAIPEYLAQVQARDGNANRPAAPFIGHSADDLPVIGSTAGPIPSDALSPSTLASVAVASSR